MKLSYCDTEWNLGLARLIRRSKFVEDLFGAEVELWYSKVRLLLL